MKVILLEDIKSLGKKGDVVEVSDGYADNFLIRTKKGVPANKTNLTQLQHQKKRDDEKAKELLEQAGAMKEKLEAIAICVTMKKGEGDRVFGSVSSKEIAQCAKEQHGLEIDKKKIVLPEPIRSFGTHEVELKLHPQVTATLHVKVTE